MQEDKLKILFLLFLGFMNLTIFNNFTFLKRFSSMAEGLFLSISPIAKKLIFFFDLLKYIADLKNSLNPLSAKKRPMNKKLLLFLILFKFICFFFQFLPLSLEGPLLGVFQLFFSLKKVCNHIYFEIKRSFFLSLYT